MTASELANALGLVPSTIRRRLKVMQSAGVVDTRGDHHWTLLEFEPADALAGTSAEGASARQAEAHRREREGYRVDYIARFGKDPYGADLESGEVAQEMSPIGDKPASVAS
jgi:DNA-binding transcriptional ArsR family regulator